MSEQDPTEWPTVKLVCSRVKDEENEKVYQGAVVRGYSAAVLEECADVAKRDMQQLASEIKTRLEWSNMKLLRSAVAFLDTQGWRSTQIDDDSDESLTEVKNGVEYISSLFREPLEKLKGY